MTTTFENRVLYSTLRPNGDVELAFRNETLSPPASDEIVVEMKATPINPTDMFLLCALADPSTAEQVDRDGSTMTVLHAADWAVAALAARVDTPMAVGSEGAGHVVAAGSAEAAQAMVGRTVALWGSGTYARYCKVKVADAMLMAEDVAPEECASAFINPMTVLSMVETMHREGFSALVHTAAASNVGQMLNRVCQADGIELVNIVRSDTHIETLEALGAKHVCNSGAPTFDQDLRDAVRATGARLAFDATGGGTLASQILAAMEKVDTEGRPVRQYGSSTKKKVYMYGKLDPSPLQISGSYGLAWSFGGWLVYNFLEDAGADVRERLKARVANEIRTTFATRYSDTVDLDAVLDPEVLTKVSQYATGGKYLMRIGRSADHGAGSLGKPA